jgi:purine-binding chemotaxis protein CheW
MIDEDEVQFVSFRLGSQEFAVEILQLRRVLPFEAPTPVPGAPSWVRGTIGFDGSRTVVVDLRERLGLPTTATPETRVLVLDLVGGPVALVVDAARRVVRVDPGTIGPAPDVAGLAPGFAVGLIDQPGHPIVILNPARLLSPEERAALGALKVMA